MNEKVKITNIGAKGIIVAQRILYPENSLVVPREIANESLAINGDKFVLIESIQNDNRAEIEQKTPKPVKVKPPKQQEDEVKDGIFVV